MLCRLAKQCEFLLGCLALLTSVAWAQPQLSYQRVSYGINTFAGLRIFGDGGPAVQTQLYGPVGVAVDGSDNLYIADRNNSIRKVDPTGTITTVAGTGEQGFGGDGGPAVQAQLASPTGVAVDGSGNLYIADSGNERIRKVDPTGTITTVAGTGERGAGGDGGPATQAQFAFPADVAVDGSGNLYIADRDTHRIRKVDPTGRITTIAGTGEYGGDGDGGPAVQAQLTFPNGVAVDGSGNLYIADSGNDRIRKVDSTGTITTVAGIGEDVSDSGYSGDGGPAVKAQLAGPVGVAVDGSGNLYIADRGNRRIRKVDSRGRITTVAGTGEYSGDGGPAVRAQLNSPAGVAVDGSGNLYIADRDNGRIRKVDSTGTITTIAGTRDEHGFIQALGDGGPAVLAGLAFPAGVAVDGSGNLYIAGNRRIRKVDPTGTITTVAGGGRFSFGGDGGPAVGASLHSPTGVAVDGSGNLYIADRDNHRIRKVDSTGTITTVVGGGRGRAISDGIPAVEAWLDSPTSVAVDGSGNLYIAVSGHSRIRKVDSRGMITTVAGMGEDGFGGDGGPAPPRLSSTFPLAWRWTARATSTSLIGETAVFARSIPRGQSPRLREEGTTTLTQPTDSTGTAARHCEEGFTIPLAWRSMAWATFTSPITATTAFARSIPWGRLPRLRGDGLSFPALAGTGVPATAAQLAFPTAVAVDGSGNLYIADSGNHRIRILMPRYRLDFAHFANGASVTSDLVLVNVAPHPIRPAFYFYDKEGSLIAAESVIEVTGDLEVAEDGALTVQTEVEPLGELTISTHGQGEVVRGSVTVVANGPIGGVLRFDLPGVGVAGVGAGQPVRDAIFPARRQASRISTAAAIRILDDDREEMRCRLMQEGAVLEEVQLDLGGDRQEAQFIEEMFTATDTSDFVGVGALHGFIVRGVRWSGGGIGCRQRHLHHLAVGACARGPARRRK